MFFKIVSDFFFPALLQPTEYFIKERHLYLSCMHNQISCNDFIFLNFDREYGVFKKCHKYHLLVICVVGLQHLLWDLVTSSRISYNKRHLNFGKNLISIQYAFAFCMHFVSSSVRPGALLGWIYMDLGLVSKLHYFFAEFCIANLSPIKRAPFSDR